MKKIFTTVFVVALMGILILSFSLMACKTTATAETTAAAATETTAAAATETTAAATETTAAAVQKKYTVGYQIYYEGNDWSLQMAEEFKYAIEKDYSDMVEKVYYVSDQYDLTKQMNNFDDLVTKGCDIIFLSPLDPKAMVEKIKLAETQGIKVVLFAINMDGEDFTASVNSKDYDIGRLNAEWIAKDAGVKGKVALLSGIAGTQTAIDVKNGVVDVLKNYPDIELLPEIFTDWDWAKVKKATQDVLAANPDIAGIIVHGDPIYVAQVFIESGKKLVPIPWQSSNGALRFWKEQKPNGLKARAFNKPAYISKVALDIGMKALKGEEIPKFTEVPLDIINEDQIDDFYRPDLSDRVWLPTYLPDDVVIKLFPKE